MTCYCTLFIRSDDRSELPSEIFSQSSLEKFDFTDEESPERHQTRKRLDAAGIRRRPDLPRYGWVLETNGKVHSTSIEDHIKSLLSCLNNERRLGDLKSMGYKYYFSVFWGGNGTGGGPFITSETSALLAEHEAEIEICFYYEDAS